MVESRLDSQYGGEFRIVVYRSKVQSAEHIALVKGDIGGPEPVLARMPAVHIIADAIGDRRPDRGAELHRAKPARPDERRGRNTRVSPVNSRSTARQNQK